MAKNKKTHTTANVGQVQVTVETSSGNFDVLWHPEAEDEAAGLVSKESVAIENAIEKLRSAGVKLDKRHSDHVGDGLWELRPRAGRSPWRAIYKRIGETTFVILAVCPEYEENKKGFNKGLKDAAKRFAELDLD